MSALGKQMSAEDRDDKDPLQSLIAEVLEAENRGESVDREKLIDQHPDHADSLRDFFASHDRMKSAAEIDPPTLPPAADSSLEDPTIQPGSIDEDPTIAPTDPALSKPASLDNGPEIGDKVRYFGDYELLEEIARGGMGVVYKARQANLNRVVALKMILAGQFAGEEDVQRFYTEAEAAASLDHPGIVPIFEIGEHAGQHYFSMGYIEGESLAKRVADGPLPPREAAELVKKICDAMAYAHERGVIHRDLKPANILIDANGQPKVTDFGLAKKTEADSGLTGTGQILGTPAYMPPEQASGKTDVGPLADVYSLGAILYCLLTGRPPFQAASPMDTLLQVLDQEPVAPRRLDSKIPLNLESITLKCLRKNCNQRYKNCADLGDDLHRFLGGEPTVARPIGSIRYAWNWYWHNLMKVAGSLTLACCAIYAISVGVGLALMLTSLPSDMPPSMDQFGGLVVGATVLVAMAAFVLTVVLIGAKCGLLTMRGHRVALIGSIVILGFIAYSFVSEIPNLDVLPETSVSTRSRNRAMISISTLAIWFTFCLATQFLALFSTDQSGASKTWSQGFTLVAQGRVRLTASLILLAIGVALIGVARTVEGLGSVAGFPGLVLVLAGILAAFRLR